MKVYLSFDPIKDREDLEAAQNGWKYKRVIEDMDNWLRELMKYKDIETIKVDEAREKLRDLQLEWLE